jgi:hypothetical protein
MAKMKSSAGADGALATTSAVATSGITAENYLERAGAFMKLAGGGFVILAIDGDHGQARTQQPATQPQWVAWMAWFDRKRIARGYATQAGQQTVPCEWPESFDLECAISDRGARLWAPQEAPIGPRDAARLQGLLEGLRSAPRRDRGLARPRDQRGAADAAREAEHRLASTDWSSPVTLSAEAKAAARIPAAGQEDVTF